MVRWLTRLWRKASNVQLTSDRFDRRLEDVVLSLGLSVGLGLTLRAHWDPATPGAGASTTTLSLLLALALWGKLLDFLDHEQEVDPTHPVRLLGRFACGILGVTLLLTRGPMALVPLCLLLPQAWTAWQALRALREERDMARWKARAMESALRRARASFGPRRG